MVWGRTAGVGATPWVHIGSNVEGNVARSTALLLDGYFYRTGKRDTHDIGIVTRTTLGSSSLSRNSISVSRHGTYVSPTYDVTTHTYHLPR